VEPKYSVEELASHGIVPLVRTAAVEPSALIDLVSPNAPTEYWLGYNNFYVLTRYNRSSFYAMAVFQLAQTLRERRGTGG
jgi:membrane-bound lytic murein transglycosylase B